VASLEGYPVKSSQVKSSQADSVVLLGPGSILEGVPRGYAVQGPGGFGVTGLDWTGLDWTGLDWTGLDWTGLDWTGLDWTGLDWTGLDWTGLDWTGLVGEPWRSHDRVARMRSAYKARDGRRRFEAMRIAH